MDLAGRIVWACLCLYTTVLWISKIRNPNGGIRLLAGRCAFCFTLLLAITLNEPGPNKLNLIWEAASIYVISMTINGKLIDFRIRNAPARAELEAKKSGEPAEAILARELEYLGYGPEGSS